MKIAIVLFIGYLTFFPIVGLCHDESHGHVTFNVADFPQDPRAQKKPQQVMFLGCETHKIVNYHWGTSGQQSKLPYQIANKKCPNGTCYASKYYMASPPVFVGDQGILGQLSPDRFDWNDQSLSQSVYMDYSVIEPLTFGEINASFDHEPNTGQASCEKQKVTLVPINIDCKNLPKIDGKIGASGIGFLKSNKGKSQIFIPVVGGKNKTLMDCTATILDDIVLEHRIYFDQDETLSKTISMTQLYNNQGSMNFVCEKRPSGDVPEGCQQ